MEYFLIWLFVGCFYLFFVVPYLRMRTDFFSVDYGSHLSPWDKDTVYLIGTICALFWPICLPGWLAYKGVTGLVNYAEAKFEKKPEPPKPKPEAPPVNAAKTTYRHVEYDSSYSAAKEV